MGNFVCGWFVFVVFRLFSVKSVEVHKRAIHTRTWYIHEHAWIFLRLECCLHVMFLNVNISSFFSSSSSSFASDVPRKVRHDVCYG